MSVITLTTDLGNKDFYAPAVKGFILSNLPNATIVEITHLVHPFNIAEAAFILRNCYSNFPPRSIHLINVESNVEFNDDFLIVEYKTHYFIARNNGVISLITDGQADKIIKLHERPIEDQLFPFKNIIARAACKLAIKYNIYDLGQVVRNLETFTTLSPAIETDMIRGSVLYIDHYGNAITNISLAHIERFGEGKKINIQCSRKVSINKISKLYNEVPEGEAICVVGSSNLLEIAINKGSASQLLGLQTRSKIIIEFE